MRKLVIITSLLISGLISLPVNAAEKAADKLELQENAPEQYVVVKGDTLWGISGRFLKKPWRWPEIWNMNKEEIKNPHLIYPGDVVVLDMVDGQPRLRLAKGGKLTRSSDKAGAHETVKLSPRIRAEEAKPFAIPSIPVADINPFLSEPLVVEPNGLDGAPYIIDAEEKRVVLGTGNTAYVHGITEDDGKDWQIYRPGKALIDPDTKEVLGHEAIYLGDARVIGYGGDVATIEITRSKQEIGKLDRLIAMPKDTPVLSYVPHPPIALVKGRVISIYGGVGEVGQNSIVTINKGRRDGIDVGSVLALYRHGGTVKTLSARDEKKPLRTWHQDKCLKPGAKVTYGEPYNRDDVWVTCPEDKLKRPAFAKLPDERYGLLFVFRVFDKVSYGLIMQTQRPVQLEDVVQTP